jgi:hypothetical protein
MYFSVRIAAVRCAVDIYQFAFFLLSFITIQEPVHIRMASVYHSP